MTAPPASRTVEVPKGRRERARDRHADRCHGEAAEGIERGQPRQHVVRDLLLHRAEPPIASTANGIATKATALPMPEMTSHASSSRKLRLPSGPRIRSTVRICRISTTMRYFLGRHGGLRSRRSRSDVPESRRLAEPKLS